MQCEEGKNGLMVFQGNNFYKKITLEISFENLYH